MSWCNYSVFFFSVVMIWGPFAPVMRGFVSVNFNLTKIKNLGANEPMYSSLDLSVKASSSIRTTIYDHLQFTFHVYIVCMVNQIGSLGSYRKLCPSDYYSCDIGKYKCFVSYKRRRDYHFMYIRQNIFVSLCPVVSWFVLLFLELILFLLSPFSPRSCACGPNLPVILLHNFQKYNLNWLCFNSYIRHLNMVS